MRSICRTVQAAIDAKKLDTKAAVTAASLDRCWRYFTPTRRCAPVGQGRYQVKARHLRYSMPQRGPLQRLRRPVAVSRYCVQSRRLRK
jgi:hypothetical protein